MPSAAAIVSLLPLVLVGLGGLAVLLYGLRGRRKGDTPYCRKCGYNLTGLTSERCPECGSSIYPRGMVRGSYHPRWVPMMASLPFLVGCLWLLGSIIYPHVRMLDVRRHYPFAWLLHELQKGDRLAFYELHRRDRGSELSEAEKGKLVGTALSELENASVAVHRAAWLELLARWDREGKLTSGQRKQLYGDLHGVVKVIYRGPSRIRSGDPLPLNLDHEARLPFAARLVAAQVTLGEQVYALGPVEREPPGTALWIPFYFSDMVLYERNRVSRFNLPEVQLPPGRYPLEYRGRYEVYGPGEERRWAADPILTEEATCTAPLEVLPAFDPTRVKLRSDPHLDAEVRRSIALETIRAYPRSPEGVLSSWYLSFRFRIRRPLPVDLACSVFLRLPDGDLELGSVAWSKGSPNGEYAGFHCPPVALGEEASVVLRADAEVARDFGPGAEDTWDGEPKALEIWGGELVLGPVKVQR